MPVTSPIDDIERLERLKASGGITGVEFERLKAKALSAAKGTQAPKWPRVTPVKFAIVIALIVGALAITLFARPDASSSLPTPEVTAAPTPRATVAADAPPPEPAAAEPTAPASTIPVITPKIQAMIDEVPQADRNCSGPKGECQRALQLESDLREAGMCEFEGEKGERRFHWRPPAKGETCVSPEGGSN
jgi:hypothetical protein